MNATQYIESGKRNWNEFRKLAEAEGYGFEVGKVKGFDRFFFYIGASDGKRTWVVQEPSNRLMVDSTIVTEMAAFAPLYKAEEKHYCDFCDKQLATHHDESCGMWLCDNAECNA